MSIALFYIAEVGNSSVIVKNGMIGLLPTDKFFSYKWTIDKLPFVCRVIDNRIKIS
jgi:hypothetical protein